MPENKIIHKEQDLQSVVDNISELLGEDEYDGDRLPPIEIGLDTYDEESFMKGVDDASYLSGYITALFNAGCSEDFVLTYLINKETIEYNLKSVELNNVAQIEIAKHQKVIIEREEL